MNLALNKKASFEYFILDTLEAGIVLKGTEVKSAKNHKISLEGSYVRYFKDKLELIDCDIAVSPNCKHYSHEPKRNRLLLLHKEQIYKFVEKSTQKGFSIIPLKMYTNEKGLIKIELAVVQGKKLFDKRHSIKERDLARSYKKY